MTKANFIQSFIISTRPSTEKIQPAIAYAEWLWDELSKKGYGDKKAATPRALKADPYDSLAGDNLAAFKAFWSAFAHKDSSKREAAAKWIMLVEQGDISPAEYPKIAAARKEGQRDFKDQARKHASGWLGLRRWKDAAPDAAQQDNSHLIAVNNLVNDLNSLKRLYDSSKSESLLASIGKKEVELKNLRTAH
jgi:hypothetical protein